MLESFYLDIAITSHPVSDRNLNNLQVLFCSTEEEIKISKRVKVPEEASVDPDILVVTLEKHLGSAESILDRLIQKPGEDLAEKFVAKQIKRPHRLFFHLIDKPCAVDELPFAGRYGVVKLREIFRGNGQI